MTNVAFCLYCRSGKALLGSPPGAAKVRYPEMLAAAWDVPVFRSLPGLPRAAIARLGGPARPGARS
jgi:hypothetical protein